MGERIIQKTIEINAAVDKVWRVFTDPAITRQMGGEYVTDWKVGSSFGWKGKTETRTLMAPFFNWKKKAS